MTYGTLPPGLTLNGSGTIAGNPTTAGTFTFTVTVTDSASHTATGSLTITINAIVSVTTSGTLSTTGEAGAAYSATLAQTGGVGPFTWTLNTGSLPTGLSIGSAGIVSGTISAAAVPGTFSFTAKVTDSQGNSAVSGTISIKVDAAVVLNSPAFPSGVVGVSYASPAFTASGGTGTGYTFALASGSIIPLVLSAGTGIISGIPTAAGTLQFSVKVAESLGFTTTTGNLSITINPAIIVALTPTTQPQTLDQGKTLAITATVSNDPTPSAGVTWTITSGLGTLTNPTATSVNYNAPANVAANSSVVVTAKSVTDQTKTAAMNINLVTPPQITTTILPTETQGTAYSSSVSMAGGVAPYTWTLMAGPAGLSLGSGTTSTVPIQGTPTTAGAAQAFTVKVTDAQGVSVTSSGLTITVLPAPVITSFAPTAAIITVGTSTNLTAVFASGTGSVNNSVGSIVSSTPVSVSPSATTTYTLTVTNTAGASVTAQATLTVLPVPVITSFLPTAATITVGSATKLTAVFSNGTGSVNNSVGAVTSTLAVNVAPSVTTTYTLTVTNTAGTQVTAQATVTVDPVPAITSFAPATSTIVAGGSTTLTAVFSNGTGSVSNGVGTVTSTTPASVSPVVTTTYTLTVTNTCLTSAEMGAS